MTIASEITRLQGAKSCIKASIEGKGVTVGSSLTLDQYAACIDAIPSGPKYGFADVLMVGGGGGTITNCYGSGGGGGGGVKEMIGEVINCECYPIVIGQGGVAGNEGCDKRGGSTYFGATVVSGGGGVSNNNTYNNGGTDGGGAGGSQGYGYKGGGKFCGGNESGANGGGGGGAGGIGCDGNGGTYEAGNGGIGVSSCISGSLKCYGGGGGGGAYYAYSGYSKGGCGMYGGGDGGCYYNGVSGKNATYYGGGGGGPNGNGCQGIVIVRYKTDGSCGILPTSSGGCKYTCGDYTIHCFVSNGVFTPVYA